MRPADAQFIGIVTRLGVIDEEVLEQVRLQMEDKGYGRAWAAQQLLKRSPTLSSKQVAQVQRALADVHSGPVQEARRDAPLGSSRQPAEKEERAPTAASPSSRSARAQTGRSPRPDATTRKVEVTERPVNDAETLELPPRRRERGEVEAGDLLGERFRVGRKLGSGAQGVVFEATDTSLERKVAIKILRTDAPGQAQTRFLREAKLVSALGHPGIVTIYDAGKTPSGALYYAMELVRGRSLDDVLDADGPLPAQRIGRILAAVGLAMHHAHDAGLVHRDLKPGNLLMDEAEGSVRVADFGLVTLAEGTRLTMTRGVVGTPVYMAPEQAEGERVDRRADVYSLGAILYEGLVGEPPFAGATPLEIFRKIVSEDPVRPRRLNPDVPELVERVCMRALEKDPRARYPTAASFSRDLHRALEGVRLAPERRGPFVLHKARRVLRTRPLAVGLVLGLGLGTVAGLLLGPERRGPARAPTPALTYPPEVLTARARDRAQLFALARSARRQGLEREALGWLGVLRPEGARWDPGAARDLAQARALEALCYLELEDLGSAQLALGRAILFDADAGPVWIARSALLARQGEDAAAKALLARGLADPEWRVEALLEEARQAWMRGATSERLAALDRAMALTRQDPWPVVLRARIQARLDAGNVEAALWDAQLLAGQLSPRSQEGFEVERVLAAWKLDPVESRRTLEGMVASIDTSVRVNARQTLRRIDGWIPPPPGVEPAPAPAPTREDLPPREPRSF